MIEEGEGLSCEYLLVCECDIQSVYRRMHRYLGMSWTVNRDMLGGNGPKTTAPGRTRPHELVHTANYSQCSAPRRFPPSRRDRARRPKGQPKRTSRQQKQVETPRRGVLDPAPPRTPHPAFSASGQAKPLYDSEHDCTPEPASNRLPLPANHISPIGVMWLGAPRPDRPYLAFRSTRLWVRGAPPHKIS